MSGFSVDLTGMLNNTGGSTAMNIANSGGMIGNAADSTSFWSGMASNAKSVASSASQMYSNGSNGAVSQAVSQNAHTSASNLVNNATKSTGGYKAGGMGGWDTFASAMALATNDALISMYNSKVKRRQLEFQSEQYKFQAQTDLLTMQSHEMQAQQIRNNMYSAYAMGENKAMMVGLLDAQALATAKAGNASSGFRMDRGSKGEMYGDYAYAHAVNQGNVQLNTTAQAMQLHMQEQAERGNALVSYGQSIVDNANANAYNIMAKRTKPLLDGFITFNQSLNQSLSK